MSKELERGNLLAKWLVGNLTGQERKNLDSAGLEELQYVVQEIDSWQLPGMNVEKKLEQVKARRLKKEPVVRKLHFSLKLAAAITLALGACLTIYLLKWPAEIQVQTALGEKIKHTFPDGSAIELDALSTLNYLPRHWKESRQVALTGRAYFNIRDGAPFIINTNQGSVAVLGTRFDVLARTPAFSVNCFEGRVEVKAGDAAAMIGAQEGVMLNNGKLEKKKINETLPSWTQGKSSYHNAPLPEVIADLKLYYKAEIALPEKYRSLRFTGTVTHHNLEDALQAVFLPMEIKYTLTGSGSVVFD
jgi:transmembrane sensor